MTWDFRLVKHTERKPRRVWYGVHEVFYNDAGKPMGMTQDPVSIDGESVKDALGYLEMIRRDLKRLPILDDQKTTWAKFPRSGSKKSAKRFKTARERLIHEGLQDARHGRLVKATEDYRKYLGGKAH